MRWLPLTLALALPPATLAANEPNCWVPYAAFEETVKHFDVERCPGEDAPTPEQGFCRMAIEGAALIVYVFRHDAGAGGPCLVAARRFDAAEFLARFGVTYRAP